MNRSGMPFFRDRSIDRLRAAIPFFADVAKFPWISGREAVLVMQWEAPAAMLGDFPNDPKLRADLVSAVNPGEDGPTMSVLADLLSAAYTNEQPIVFSTDGDPVTFYLDLPGYPEWVPIVRRGEELLLSFGADMAFSIDSSAQPGVGPDDRSPSAPARRSTP
jgi:hypothetical protein